jgi:hypothetical protein
VLVYLARYTHSVAIFNRRLIRADAGGVIFTVKDYRVEGLRRYTTMTLNIHEFIRRFLIHVLPKGLHRIRHYRILAGHARAGNLARIREQLAVRHPQPPRPRRRPRIGRSSVAPAAVGACGSP